MTKKTLILALFLLSGCDSGLAYRADLGQAGKPPSVEATLGASTSGQTLTFQAPAGGTLPAEWTSAQSLKVSISNTFLPIAKASGALATTIPPTLPFAKPLDDSAVPMVFLVNNDHTMVARVALK